MTTLPQALAEIRESILSPGLIRAVGSGRRRGGVPSITRATIRPVVLKSGARLQIVTDDGQRRPTTKNVSGTTEIDKLLAEPFGNWLVETTSGTLQMRATKKGASVHRSPSVVEVGSSGHDRAKEHLLDPSDPLFAVLGANAAKRRQVDAFLRQLPAGDLPKPLHVVDLGCGNAYLTFAAYSYLSLIGLDVRLTGVDVCEDQRARNTEIAQRLGWSEQVSFVAGEIATVELEHKPDIVLALHACDTATDDALARAVQWRAKWILAAPCCHKDISRQLRQQPAQLLTAHGILRERFADVLTDVARAALLREHGYDVEVVEFIDSAHTPRNALIRAVRGGRTAPDQGLAELLEQWKITPALESLLQQTGDAGGRVG